MSTAPKDRRETLTLSDEQMNEIAERAAAYALSKVYEEVGKNIVKKFFWLVGVFAMALVFTLGKWDMKLPFGG